MSRVGSRGSGYRYGRREAEEDEYEAPGVPSVGRVKWSENKAAPASPTRPPVLSGSQGPVQQLPPLPPPTTPPAPVAPASASEGRRGGGHCSAPL
ncbi:hypothetical protein Pmani_028978 [Petrolisthes manimaculis]|uniref:Uncharacterized protein n=1 Tax=Petrolisthes manimaculis TaxID=1843537 RepID=A0AAE1P152_9EUCA|nr:hypothetical protein Pmani_028978 [Petrolisthes manimaculis]